MNLITVKNLSKIIISFFIYNFLNYSAFSYQDNGVEKYVYSHLSQDNGNIALTYLNNLEGINNAEGLFVKGLLYLRGSIGYINLPLANYYFTRAATLDYPPALKALADSYLSGDGIEKNELYAFRLYYRAAVLGYGSGQFNVAVMFKNGQGISKNFKQAYLFFDKASKNDELGQLKEDAKFYRDEMKKLIKIN